MNVETLSPQARAVYYAIAEISPAPAGEIAAAALRAAVEQLGFQDDYGTRLINVEDLFAITNELETL